MESLSGVGSLAIGVLAGVISTCIQSIGLTLQRKSHLQEDAKDRCLQRPPYLRRRWQVGMSLFLMANIFGSGIQITTLPLPVLSALQASGLVFNSVCASILLSEPFTRFSLIGTVLVAIGAILVASFGAIAEPSHTLEQLLELLAQPQFMIWMVGTFTIVGIILTGSWLLQFAPHDVSFAHRFNYIKGMCNGAVSGILSAHTLLIAKSAVELVVRTIVDGNNQFKRWESWVILAGLVTFALLQLYFLHQGLKLVSTSVLYPFVFCVYNVITILDGLIYFRQTSRLPLSHAALIAVGTAILLSGVLALSWRLEGQTSADCGDRPQGYSRVVSPNNIPSDDVENRAFEHSANANRNTPFILLGLRPTDAGGHLSSSTTISEESPLLSSSSQGRTNQQTPYNLASRPYHDYNSTSTSTAHHHSPLTTATTTSADADSIWDELNQDSLAGGGRPRKFADDQQRRHSLPLFQKLARSKVAQDHSFRMSQDLINMSSQESVTVAYDPAGQTIQTRRQHSRGNSRAISPSQVLSLSPESLISVIDTPPRKRGHRKGDSLAMRPLLHNTSTDGSPYQP